MQLRSRPAFTILDTVLGLFIVTTIILLFGGLINARDVNRRALTRAQAAAIVDEQINALRVLGVSNLNDQTNGSFRNVLYNAGRWSIVTGGVTGNALDLALNPSITNAVSGRLLFPAGVYDTGELQADWYVQADSPSSWSFGYMFHATDASNGYRLRIAATATDLDTAAGGTQNLILESLVAGTPTTIFSKQVTIAEETWYELRVVLAATSPTIRIYIDSNQQDSSNITDTTFTNGSAALVGWNGIHALVDDAQTITSSTETWDFNGAELPTAWVRLGLNDVPDGTPNTFEDNGLLTISDFISGGAKLKEAVVNVEWEQAGQTKNYTSTVLIGSSDFGS